MVDSTLVQSLVNMSSCLWIVINFTFFLLVHVNGNSIEEISRANDKEESGIRSGKFFPIANIAPNICMGDSEMGICKTMNACARLNGTKVGSATCGTYGLGICCLPVFTPTVNQVPLPIREKAGILQGNQNFEENYFLLPRLNGSCQVRLDFKSFNFQPPRDGVCTVDSFSVTGSITVKSLTLCGQVMKPLYFSYGSSEAIRFDFRSESRTRFEVKFQHIDCNSMEKVDDHCLMNYNADSGEVRSFGYMGMGGYQINGHDYAICVGNKVSQYSWEMCETSKVSPEMMGNTNSFYLSHYFGTYMGSEAACTGKTSYVAIPGVGTYCGGYFKPIPKAPTNMIFVKTVKDDFMLYNKMGNFYSLTISEDFEWKAGPKKDCADGTAPLYNPPTNPFTIFNNCKTVAPPAEMKQCVCTELKSTLPTPTTARATPIGFCLRYTAVS